MTTFDKREKLANYIQFANDKRINEVFALLEREIKDDERISIEQYNKELDESMAQIKAGEVYTHQEVVEMAKKW